jgi:hypothetical protein
MTETSKKNDGGQQRPEEAMNGAANGAAEVAGQIGGSMAEAAQIYTEAAQRTSDRLSDVIAAYSRITTDGAQRMQSAWADWLKRRLDTNRRASEELLRCRDFRDVAEVHRDLLQDGLTEWLSGSAEMLRISGEIAAAALRPIEDRVERRK